MSAGLTDVTREPDRTPRTLGADCTGEANVTCRSSVALVTFEAAIPLRTRHAFSADGPWRPSQSSWAGGTCWAKCSARAYRTNGSRCAILAILAIVSTDTFRPSCSGGTGATSHLDKCERMFVIISTCPHEN